MATTTETYSLHGEAIELTERPTNKLDSPNPVVPTIGHEESDTQSPIESQQYPRGIRLAVITVGIVLSIFIIALDTSILATAIPSITSEFGSIDDVAWYGSSYSIGVGAFQSSWGKAYNVFPLKTIFLITVGIFEIGNVISAVAPSTQLLIFGRVVAGFGGGGVTTGAFTIIALTAGPKYRAAFMGVCGFTFGCSSVAGPLIGGALTDGLGWRWCFWISLPIAFAAVTTVTLSFKSPLSPPQHPLLQKLVTLDLNGAVLVAGFLSCFVLAMHWIGIYPWTNARVIGSLMGFICLTILFALNEWKMGDNALIQPRFFKNKIILANLLYIFFLAGAFFPLLYTLPIQFQSANNSTASQSGILLIPLVLGVSIFTMITNGLITVWRVYKPWLLLGAVFATIGNAKILTLDTTSSTAEWVGWELMTGVGVGLALQIPIINNQSLVPADDIPVITSLTLFVESVGTALFVAAGEGAFVNGLLKSLRHSLPSDGGIGGIDVLHAGATKIRDLFAGGELDGVLRSFQDGCRTSYLVTVACGAVAGIISFSNAGPAGARWVKLRLKKSHER